MSMSYQVQRAPSKNTPCLRSMRAPPEETARLLGMTVEEAKNAPYEKYCAAHLVSELREVPLHRQALLFVAFHFWTALAPPCCCHRGVSRDY